MTTPIDRAAPIATEQMPAQTSISEHGLEDAGATHAMDPLPERPAVPVASRVASDARADIIDGVPDEADGWGVADQPTVVISPAAFNNHDVTPEFLRTAGLTSWPPTPTPARKAGPPQRHSLPSSPPLPRPIVPDGAGDIASAGANRPRPAVPSFGLRGAAVPTGINGPRLAAPNGRPVPDASASIAALLSNPRMHRFQELRRQRVNHDQGAAAPDDNKPVAEMVRQWWTDLKPVLGNALHYQHEARQSGMYPLPAQAAAPMGRLGDMFGRLAASARELTERAQTAAAPRLKQLHDQAEQAAQAIVNRIEGDQIRQQGPFLGPGRIAVYFRPAVSVGQAQRLLAATQARPLRIIPRKHGFLVLVRPGTEATVSDRLRKHPYVSDVIFLEYDEFGDPIEPQRA